MAVAKYPFPIVGGLERQAHDLAKTLVQHGHTVHALSSRFEPEQKLVDLIDGVRIWRVEWVEFRPARFLLFPFTLVHLFLKLKGDMDLVHVHNISWFGAFVTVLAKGFGMPVITKLPNVGAFGIPGMRRGSFGSLRIALLKRSDSIVAMTPQTIAELEGIGYLAARIPK
jgi:glycosyltransferase involved in cell wall biosynthesis